MQFLSFIPRYFARRKAVADLRERSSSERTDNVRKLVDQMVARRDEDARNARMQAVVHGDVDTQADGMNSDSRDFCTGAPVYDSDNDLQIMGIMGVNAKAGWVLVADLPVQLTEHGHIKSRRLRFSSIIEFKPNDQSSGSFHCYGRLPDGKEG